MVATYSRDDLQDLDIVVAILFRIVKERVVYIFELVVLDGGEDFTRPCVKIILSQEDRRGYLRCP